MHLSVLCYYFLVGEAPPGEVRGIRMSARTETLTLLHVLIELHMITEPLQHCCSVKEWH